MGIKSEGPAGINLYEKVQALALMRGESEVKSFDIKRMALSAMVGRFSKIEIGNYPNKN